MDPKLFDYGEGYNKEHSRLVRQTVETVCLECPVMIHCGADATSDDRNVTSRGGMPPLMRPGRPSTHENVPIKFEPKSPPVSLDDFGRIERFIENRGGVCINGHNLNANGAVRVRGRSGKPNTPFCVMCAKKDRHSSRKRAKIKA